MEAVSDVSFEIGDEEFVAIVGPSGCGKSTILNMIAGLVEPSAGVIEIDGWPVTGVPANVGYVFQKDTVFPWRTVRRNIALGLEYRGIRGDAQERRVAAAVSMAGLEGFEDAFPATLSGGMRQRVALVRTLILEPQILLMDEPFGALDLHTKLDLHGELLTLWGQRRQTVVFITHDLSEAITLADRIVVMTRRPGRIKMIYDVKLTRPRDVIRLRETDEYLRAYGEIWHVLGEEFASVLFWQLLLLVVLLASWEWLTGIKAISKTPGLYWIDPFFISRPTLIARRFAYLLSDRVRLSLWQMTLSTVQSTLWGFVVGVSTGFVAGLVLGRNDRLARIFEPYIVAFNSLPRIALVPLITMIFGFGLVAKIVLAWTIVFFIVFFNTFQGARSVDADLIHSARFLGASEHQVMRTVIIPSALAWTFASLTPSISFALIGVVVGEFLGGESGGGLGYLIIQSLGTLNAADMMVALLTLGLIGIVMALGIKQVEMRLLRWRPEYRKGA